MVRRRIGRGLGKQVPGPSMVPVPGSVGAEQVRRELFRRLDADYPQLPVAAVITIVADADRALRLCGYGDAEVATFERMCRHNLDALVQALRDQDGADA